jgi:hypothetical protein
MNYLIIVYLSCLFSLVSVYIVQFSLCTVRSLEHMLWKVMTKIHDPLVSWSALEYENSQYQCMSKYVSVLLRTVSTLVLTPLL